MAQCGIYNSLAQLAIKIGAPGVPDFYQGTEVWDFSLVDPDNRRPVDYERRRRLLSELDEAVTGPWPGVSRRGAHGEPARRSHEAVYQPACCCASGARIWISSSAATIAHSTPSGTRHEHVFAFARAHRTQSVAVIVPRLTGTLLPDADTPPLGEHIWGDTTIDAPPGGPASYRHVLTGATVCARESGGRRVFRAADVFAVFPVAFLESR